MAVGALLLSGGYNTTVVGPQIGLSAAVAAVEGYLLGAFGPLALGFERSINAAGAVVVVAGLLQTLAMVFGPRRKGYVLREAIG